MVLDSYNSPVKRAGQVFLTHFIIAEMVPPWPKSYSDIAVAGTRSSHTQCRTAHGIKSSVLWSRHAQIPKGFEPSSTTISFSAEKYHFIPTLSRAVAI